MSYLRWVCAMHFAKLARRGNAFVETVNAFRVHRQQKTAACEAAAQARAEFWSRFTENVRRIRAGQLNYVIRRSLQSRRLDHVNENNANFREPGTDTKCDGGNFHNTAKEGVNEITFHGAEGNAAAQKITALSTMLRNSICEQRDAIGELLQQKTKQAVKCLPQLSQPQRNLSIDKNNNKEGITTTPKSLAMCAVSQSCAGREGATPGFVQKCTQQTKQEVTSATNKSPNEPFLLVHPTAPDKSTNATQLPVPTMQMRSTTNGTTQKKEKALFLPEKPNILVLPEMTGESNVELKNHATAIYEALQETKSKCCVEPIKLLTAPANTLKSTPQCQISTEPANCILPPQSDSPMTLLITNVLDKYKIISLPAGRSIPGQPKRHVAIPTRKRSPMRTGNQTDFKRKKY